MRNAVRHISVAPSRPVKWASSTHPAFNVELFLDTAGLRRNLKQFREKEVVFSQGDSATDVIYIQKGGVKLTIVNEVGREAVVALLGPGDLLGEGCLTGLPLRMGTATAIAPTTVLII